MLRRFSIFLASLLVISLIAVWLISIYINPGKETLGFEVEKALLQVGVVAVLGALVSLFSFEYQQERQQKDKERDLGSRKLEYRENLLKVTLDQARENYSAVKKARRLLRARAIIQETGSEQERVLREDYDKYLDIVNDAQLSFEHLVGDVQTSKQAFTHPKQLEKHFRSIEEYLGRLVDEYEDNRRTFQGEPLSKELGSLRRLGDFLRSSQSSEFRAQVIEPYHQIQRHIRSDLLHPQLPKSQGTEFGQ